jgi:hypothetical protein
MAKSQKYKVVALRRRRKEIENELDLELELTFPASDALQIIRSGPPALRTQRRRSTAKRGK